MRVPWTQEQIVRTAGFAVVAIGAALVAAAVLGIAYALAKGTSLLEGFTLMSFVVFLVLLVFAFLSGPGTFLGRPRLLALRWGGRPVSGRWRSTPTGADREFHELVLLTAIAFLFLGTATAITFLLGG